jgi:hypothetical protein
MRLGHLSFDLLCRLSGLGLLRGLPLLKFESDLVCAPCRHGKMIAASYSPVNTVMTKHPGQLLHMDTVGPSRVRPCWLGPNEQALECTDTYGTNGIPKLSSFMCRLDGSYPTIPNGCTSG